MTLKMFWIPFLLAAVLLATSSVESFTSPDLTSLTRPAAGTSLCHHHHTDKEDPQIILSRRHLILAVLGTSIFLAASSSSKPSHALKPRNEQLCGTGFFDNFMEYRCTDIGDISDEGKSTSLSASEAGAADSLLSKMMNLESIEIVDDVKGSNKQENRSEEKAAAVEEKK